MKDDLEKIIDNAYSPYYKFKVAAGVLTKDGKKFFGVNVENINGTSVCAERNAIASAVCAGYKKGDFSKIYIMFNNGKLGVPCFACRQVILEFFNNEAEVISIDKDGNTKSYTVKELCPFVLNLN